MKKFLKWTFLILIVAIALVACVYYLTQYLNPPKTASDKDPDCNTGRTFTKTFNRHYTKLNLY